VTMGWQAVPADSVRAVLRQVFAAPEFRWRESPNPLRWIGDALRAVIDWLGALSQSHPGAYVVVMLALLAVSVTLLVHVAWLAWQAVARGVPAGAAAVAPVPAPRDAAWYLERARQLGAAGRFADAVAHRYLALALQLAERRAVAFHPSKTPAELAAEARLEPAARTALQALTATLYGYRFGGEPCDAAAWARFDRGAADLASHAAPA
jgi:Domain of unknown function (DUF4129)